MNTAAGCGHAPLIDTNAAAVYLDLEPDTLKHWRSARKGPSYVRIGGSVKYRIADLDAWIEARKVDPAAA
ncbi:helix-turn-helix domain-containing protein [Crossiella sp. CA-258035]|uniref:helix-turn-helix domain-containing protein n=1 Tax=Crossiella sp. CA-258035 TaxID=2981138 RepID=UPI0024BC7233|nr:helix-turn-helix domain-containing protein [Crossiella sp. CA-258035]WHT20947.1 helix-turn-helix domain-containing protein [Crossiella sp. CA-258035]